MAAEEPESASSLRRSISTSAKWEQKDRLTDWRGSVSNAEEIGRVSRGIKCALILSIAQVDNGGWICL